jgi:8-oxo-dGTP pyrophosphatase MutT (NUDIX family)
VNNQLVVGFAFKIDRVVLIQKLRPEWQAGHLNGIGGKIEDGECAKDAMVREFEEETGVRVEAPYWTWTQTIDFPNGVKLFCYATRLNKFHQVRTIEDEPVFELPINFVMGLKPHPALDIQSHIRWALDVLKRNEPTNQT